MKLEPILIFVLMVFSFWLVWSANNPSLDNEEVFVVRVIDGDTIITSENLKIRLRGINTPERKMFKYDSAKEFLKKLILNKTIKLQSFGKDKYGREIGYLFLDKENINNLILKKGFAHLYYYDKDEDYETLQLSEKNARLNELGIWEKSKNFGCIIVEKFIYLDLTEKDSEILELINKCNKTLDILIKDDATHIYRKKISKKLTLETKNIWNDNGDSIYIWDSDGLIYFYRYSS